MKRTELVGGISSVLNGLLGIAYGTGQTWATPELIGAINGIATPLMLIFLGNRVSRVEDKADTAATESAKASAKATITNQTINQIKDRVG